MIDYIVTWIVIIFVITWGIIIPGYYVIKCSKQALDYIKSKRKKDQS